MNKITIAVDGYSSTGKSTIARQLAKALGYVYVDTGAMYRGVTYYAITHHMIKEDGIDTEALLKVLPGLELEFRLNEKEVGELFLNGENVEKEIRTMTVSNQVSKIAAISEVRKKLVEQQQKMGAGKGVVMDGRDIGTVVFPDAELKLFMTASPETRAARRYKELLERGEEVEYEAVLENVKSRDYLDTTRKDSPLKMAQDAIEIDNSDMGLEEQFDRVYHHAKRLIESHAS